MVRSSALYTHNWNPQKLCYVLWSNKQHQKLYVSIASTWKLVIIWKWDCYWESSTLISTINVQRIFWMTKQKIKCFTFFSFFMCCCLCLLPDNTICYGWNSQQSCNNLNQNDINLHHNPTQQTAMTMIFSDKANKTTHKKTNNNIWYHWQHKLHP